MKPLFRYSLWTCLIPSEMFFIFIVLIIIPVENIMCQDMVFRNPILLMCMGSHHRVAFLYLSRIPLGTFCIMIGSTFLILRWTFCLENMAHWVHRFPQPSLCLLAKLGYFVGCCYQSHVGFDLPVGWWWTGIALSDHPYLYCSQCIVCSFTPLMVWGSRNHSPWCAHSYYFWEGESCSCRRYHTWSSWMSFVAGYEWKIHSNLDCCKSLDGVSAQIKVKRC